MNLMDPKNPSADPWGPWNAGWKPVLKMVVQTTNHTVMKKAASISLKLRKFITTWFDNKCVAPFCGTAEERSAMHLISTYNVGEKLRK